MAGVGLGAPRPGPPVAEAVISSWRRFSFSSISGWPKSAFRSARPSVLVLRENLYGLEIDPRCTQIAAFNLALAAWSMAGEPVDLPRLNIACSGLAPNASEAEWIQVAERAEDSTGLAANPDLFGRDPSLASGPVRQAMAGLHKLFSRAPELGSLLDPGSLAGGDLFQADLGSLRKSLTAAIRHERGSGSRDERAVAAAGMARAAEILQGEYTLVVTNVPFLARGKQGARLRKFAETHHSDAKGDIATGVRVADLRVAGPQRDDGGRVAAELAVPEDVPEAAREAAEEADVECGGAVGARVRSRRSGGMW